MRLILYSKPGCHLCEGLQEKLEQIQTLKFDLEIRDITTRDDWFQQYQYEIPVLFLDKEHGGAGDENSGSLVTGHRSLENKGQRTNDKGHATPQISPLPTAHSPLPTLIPLPRPSPRASVQQLEQMLQKYSNNPAQ